ncbi:MAG TPA: PAS domain-containing protein, partial [Pedobacter sp.]
MFTPLIVSSHLMHEYYTQFNLSLPFLQDGGEMGEMLRSFDWSSTALGFPETWPVALKQTVSMMLNNPFPVLMCWGEQYIQMYNDAFRPILGQTKHPRALGISASETYAEIWETIEPMFQGVMNGKPVSFPNFMVPLHRNGYMEDCYFDFSYSPIKDENGEVQGVLVICIETTEKVRAIERLSIYQQNIRNMVRQAPVGMCVVRGQSLIVEEINDLFLELVGKERHQFKNTPYWEVIPEAAALYSPITDRVMETGETFHAIEHEIMLIRKGKEEIVHVDFVYEALKDINGKVDGIIIIAIDVTDKVAARKVVEKASEELAAVNKEMAAYNQELTKAQANLKETITALAASESRFKFLVNEAPVAIAVLRGRELMIESANEKVLKIWGKSNSIIGKTLAAALPELDGQPFLQQLDDVYTSGEAHYGYETKALLEHDGLLKDIYFDFIYQPLCEQDSNAKTIMVVATDVTKQVISRKELERAEESLRIAVEAAELGSFSIHVVDRTFQSSPRLKQFFGFSPDEELTYEAATNQIHPDYRKVVTDLVEAAIVQGTRYDIEYPIIGNDNGKVRWVRGIGTVHKDDQGINEYFTGVLHEITEKKLDEIRKNDFIGMVSHELKTPLTSLSAYVQMLHQKAVKAQDDFSAGALD